MPNDIQKNQIDIYLKALANEFKRITSRKVKAEITIVGGGALMLNYDFRMNSVDIDAFNTSEEAVKTAALKVAERFDLPADWLNDDFKKTASYSPKLYQYCVPYKTFNRVLNIRTVTSEYLIAMKLRSGRQYKSDLSDVLGILAEHEKEGTPLSMKQIRKAVTDLYGDWDSLPNASQVFIENVMENSGFEQLYEQIAREEQETKELLIQFEENYPGIITRANVNGNAENLQEKADRASILARLRQKKSVDTKITDEKKSGG